MSTAVFGAAAESLTELDLVVVQHLFMTGTAQAADVVLPCTAFGEEQVSFTNTERRIQLATQVIEPPPGPMTAWRQVTRVAHALGANWGYTNSAEVMEEIGHAVPFYAGASHENLAREYGRQWPCTKDKPLGTRFLFKDGLPDRRFKFVPVARATPVPAAPEYPLLLVFGHSHYYWHHNVLIQHSETLKREYRILLLDYPNGFVEINTDDARQLGIRDGERIRIQAASGDGLSYARVTPEVKAGTVFVPYFVRQVEQQILGSSGHGHQPVPVRLLRYTT